MSGNRASLRGTVRDKMIGMLSRAGAMTRARREVARRGLIVLTFHRIVPDAQQFSVRSPRGMVVCESLFRELVDYLASRTTCIAASELGHSRRSSPQPKVLVTFDDGWRTTRPSHGRC